MQLNEISFQPKLRGTIQVTSLYNEARSHAIRMVLYTMVVGLLPGLLCYWGAGTGLFKAVVAWALLPSLVALMQWIHVRDIYRSLHIPWSPPRVWN